MGTAAAKDYGTPRPPYPASGTTAGGRSDRMPRRNAMGRSLNRWVHGVPGYSVYPLSLDPDPLSESLGVSANGHRSFGHQTGHHLATDWRIVDSLGGDVGRPGQQVKRGLLRSIHVGPSRQLDEVPSTSVR